MRILLFLPLMLWASWAGAADLHRYVNPSFGTDSAGYGEGVLASAYRSMAYCLTANATDLTDDGGDMLYIHCAGTTTDSGYVDFSGWTTNTTNYIEIVGDSTGVWSDAVYTLKNTGTAITLQNTAKIVFRNIQIWNYMTTNQYGYAFIRSGGSGSQSFWLINSLVRGGGDETTHQYAQIGFSDNSYGAVYLINSVFYDFSIGSGEEDYAAFFNYSTAYVYNCTFYNNENGIRGNGNDIVMKNCIASGNDVDYLNTFHTSSTNNISADDTAPANEPYYRESTMTYTNAAGGDFSLAASDTDAIDTGADLSSVFTNDITGKTRPVGAAWDIGAFEYGAESALPYRRTNKVSGWWE